MANYIQNKLVVNCSNAEELQLFLNAIEGDNRIIDFNKINPIPEDLIDTIEECQSSYNNLYYYLKVSDKLDEVEKISKCTSIFKLKDSNFTNMSEDEIKNAFEMGRIAYENFIKYGNISLYGWLMDNWGGEWNSLENELFDEDNSATIYFVSRGNDVLPIIQKLNKMFPNIHIEYMFASEDRGSNVGIAKTNKKGILKFREIKDDTRKAKEIFRECWGSYYHCY